MVARTSLFGKGDQGLQLVMGFGEGDRGSNWLAGAMALAALRQGG